MMKKAAAIAMCLSVFFGSIQTGSVAAKAAAESSQPHYEYNLDNHDASEFEKSNWSNGDMFNCKWVPQNISFENGIMDMKIDQAADGYTGAEYRTKQYFGYGLYQVCMKPIKNDGVVSSFFTYTGPNDGTPWDEIDIEFLGKDTTHVQFNYYVNGRGGHEYWYDLGFDASQEFHTYGFNWYEGGITWYVDGSPVYTAPSADIFPSHPGKIMMNVWPGTGVDDWLNAYNGNTPLHAYYEWLSWDAPNNIPPTSALFDHTKVYKLLNRNSGLALDVNYGNTENGTNVLQYGYNGYNNQKWILQLQSNGYYAIKNLTSGKVLTVENSATGDGANVYQWAYAGNSVNTSQEWKIIPSYNNTYKIINRRSGLLLNVAWSSTDANANIEQYHDVNGDAQLWWIDLAD